MTRGWDPFHEEWMDKRLAMLSGEQEVGFLQIDHQTLRPEDFEKVAATIRDSPNYGKPAQLFVNSKVLEDLKKTMGGN